MDPGVSGVSGVSARGSEEQSDTQVNEELLDSGGDVCVPASTLAASLESSTGKGTGPDRDGGERREDAGASSRARTPRQSESSELPGVVGV